MLVPALVNTIGHYFLYPPTGPDGAAQTMTRRLIVRLESLDVESTVEIEICEFGAHGNSINLKFPEWPERLAPSLPLKAKPAPFVPSSLCFILMCSLLRVFRVRGSHLWSSRPTASSFGVSQDDQVVALSTRGQAAD